MKEETNETATTQAPSEAEMNSMYNNSWLDYHADAQKAKQDLDRRYAKLVNAFGSYKQMPDGVKEIVKQDYAEHKAKWSENGEEQQKRFGMAEPAPADKMMGIAEQTPTDEQTQKRQAFLHKVQEQRNVQQSRNAEIER